MSYNGSGTFQINTTGQPVVTGTVISSSAFNALTADLATGLSTAITKDGQTATTARIPFAQGISSTLVTDSTSVSTGSIITAGGAGIAKALYVGTTANIAGVLSTTSPNITTSITTPSTSFDLINATATTLNLGGAATAVNVGAATGTMTVANTTLAAKAITASTTLSVTGVTTVQAGTAALPAITTTGDTNTGIFFPAADTIAFTEGGAEAMRIDSSGNLGIGTSSPSTKLDVSGAITALGGNSPTGGFNLRNVAGTVTPRLTNDAADGTVIRAGASGASVKFNNFANTTEMVLIDSSGNVGIGTSSPTTKLNVNGTTTTTTLVEATGAAWTAYTPTLAVDTGTITTSIINARYRQLGKTIFISLSITFTVTSGSPTEFRITFPSSQVAPNSNQYTPAYLTFNSTNLLGLVRATANAYGMAVSPSNGLAYLGNCGVFVNTVFELN